MDKLQRERKRLLFAGIAELVVGALCMPFGFPCFIFGIFTLIKANRIRTTVPVKVKLPEKPVVQKTTVIPAYQKRIARLEELESQADKLLASLASYLNQLFADSQVTKSRYMTTISKAEAITDINLEKAKKAISLFGTGQVTKDRIELLDGYVSSSEKMVAEIDNIVTELMRAEQSQLTRDTQTLDTAMNELKETVKYYTPA